MCYFMVNSQRELPAQVVAKRQHSKSGFRLKNANSKEKTDLSMLIHNHNLSIPALRRLKQENQEAKISLDYKANSYHPEMPKWYNGYSWLPT